MICPVITRFIIFAVFILQAFTAKANPKSCHIVNINTASRSELMSLPSIGETKATAILTWREKHPFLKPQDLMAVKGIGEKTFNKMKPCIAITPLPQAPLSQTPHPQTQLSDNSPISSQVQSQENIINKSF